jgi:CubicO group peptidase (beta-lactamase class C family)
MSELSARIDAAVEAAIVAKRIVGAVVVVMRDGTPAHHRAYGLMDREANRAMRTDTLFRLSSITKPIAAAAALRMIELGHFTLDSVVTDFLPEFRPKLPDGSAPPISIRQLLTHTAGLSYDFLQPPGGAYQTHRVSSGSDQPGLSMAEELRRISDAGLSFVPGSAWMYSNATDVLGALMEQAAGESLPAIIQRHVTAPLEMGDTAFHVVDRSRLAVPYADASPEPIRMPEVHFQPFMPDCAPIAMTLSRAFDAAGFHSAGSGMSGSAVDIARFLDVIRAGGAPIVSRETSHAMMSNQIGPLRLFVDPTGSTAFSFGGSILLDPVKTQSPLSAGSCTWGGVWGHSWFVDPARRMTIVNLTNTTLEGMMGQTTRDIVTAAVG